MNKNFIEKIAIIIVALFIIGAILTINTLQRIYCESHNGIFIIGFTSGNKCIYK